MLTQSMQLMRHFILGSAVLGLFGSDAYAMSQSSEFVSSSNSLSLSALILLIGAGYIPLMFKLIRSKSAR